MRLILNKCWFVAALTLCINVSIVQAEQYSLGASLDPDKYMQVAKIPPLARGDYDNLPNSVSLKKYLPSVGDQGRSGSCVGWSAGYAAGTLAESRRLINSKPSKVLDVSFSPAYIYNQIKLDNSGCDNGSYISDALELMKTQGLLSLQQYPYSDSRCHRLPTGDEKKQAKAFRIADYRRLSSSGLRSSLHISTRKALSRSNPVVIGMQVGNTFMKHRGKASVKFSEQDYRAIKTGNLSAFGGHAMTVVGYDDKRDGGAFEIVNSWGEKWGDDGFFWMSYKDFNIWVLQAYELIPPPQNVIKPKKIVPNVRGEITFIGFDGKEISLKANNKAAWLAEELFSGSRFRAQLAVAQNSYVYVVGADKSSGKHVALFPHAQTSSAFLGANERMLLPGPTEDYFSQLNSTQGVDYFVILSSLRPLKIDKIVERLDSESSASITQRLKAAIGKNRLKISPVKAGDAAGFSEYLEPSQVMAKVISIEHGARKTALQDAASPLIVVSTPQQLSTEYITAGSTLSLNINEPYIIKGSAQDQSMIQHVDISGALEVKFSSRGGFKAILDPQKLSQPSDNKMEITAIDIFGNSTTKTYTIQLRK